MTGAARPEEGELSRPSFGSFCLATNQANRTFKNTFHSKLRLIKCQVLDIHQWGTVREFQQLKFLPQFLPKADLCPVFLESL